MAVPVTLVLTGQNGERSGSGVVEVFNQPITLWVKERCASLGDGQPQNFAPGRCASQQGLRSGWTFLPPGGWQFQHFGQALRKPDSVVEKGPKTSTPTLSMGAAPNYVPLQGSVWGLTRPFLFCAGVTAIPHPGGSWANGNDLAVAAGS